MNAHPIAQDAPPTWEGSSLPSDASASLHLESALDVSIIIPAFREAENLPILVPRIAASLDQAGLRGEIVVVDDNSQDGTDLACQALADSFPVRLLVRTHERGLSSAVVHGMRHAEGEVFVVMDADLSHPPEKIPELVQAVRGGDADFAIGSRYVSGGATDENWGLFRWVNSKAATLLARPLSKAKDPMAGFFALARQTFEEGAETLDPVGYKIGLEIMVKCGCRRIKEVPIRFQDRVHGQSKMNFTEQVNYLRHLRRLYVHRLGRWAQFAQFVVVGSTGMVIDLLVFSLLLTMLPGSGARAVAIGTAMTWNFWLNRRLTFSAMRGRRILPQFVLFCLACSLGAFVNWSIFVTLHAPEGLLADAPLLAAFVGILGGTICNFLMSKYVAFRPSAAPAGKIPAPQ